MAVFGIPNCADDDGVDDTPMQGLQTPFDCNVQLNTCETSGGDLPDLIENHMDYSSEVCKNMFTRGQVAIMRGVLENERKGLLDQISSTSEDNVEFDISIYPNPVSDLLNIKNDSDENVSVVLLSLNGQRMHSLQMTGGEVLGLKMSQLQTADGVYLLQFTGKSGSTTKRFLYQR